jgi:type II secretory pathway pseudopilin PulG
MRSRSICARRPRQAAFTYVGLLIAVAVLGVGLAAIGQVWRTVAAREKERELLFIGDQYRAALRNYYIGTPAGQSRYPRRLEDLLEDRRLPVMRRHLRRAYPDPITGSDQWGIVPSFDGGIAGVYSLSEQHPLKIARFTDADEIFEGAKRYSDWKFAYAPAVALLKPPVPAATDPKGPQAAK